MSKYHTATVRRQHKDRIFCSLFSEKENAMSLYNAVRNTDYTDLENLQIVTLSDAVYMTRKNDLAICFHDSLSLFEQQSSVNPNMPLRGFLYFAKAYEAWLASNGKETAVFGRSLVKIPAPEYYVLYNGAEAEAEEREYRLSDAFLQKSEGYEWTARLLNINAGQNGAILGRCPKLYEYAEFIGAIRRKQKEKLPIGEAVEGAIEECIGRGVLKEYLTKQRAEVADMILTDFDQDAYEEMLKEEALKQGRAEGHENGLKEGLKTGQELGKAEGLKTGHERGRTEGLKEGKTEAFQAIALRMLAQGEPEEKILAYTGLTREQLQALKA